MAYQEGFVLFRVVSRRGNTQRRVMRRRMEESMLLWFSFQLYRTWSLAGIESMRIFGLLYRSRTINGVTVSRHHVGAC